MSLGLREQATQGVLDPRQLPGLVGWWDLDSVNGVGNTRPVDMTIMSSWGDRSQAGNILTSSGTNRPYYRTPTWNTMPAVCITAPAFSGTVNMNSSYLSGVAVTTSPTTPYMCLPVISGTATGAAPGVFNDLAYLAPVTAGKVYTAMASFIGPTGRNAQVIIGWKDANGNSVAANPAGTATPVTSTAWTTATLTATAPAGAVQARVSASFIDCVNGDAVQFTGLGIGLGTVSAAYYLPPGNPEGVHFAGINSMTKATSYSLQSTLCWVGRLYGSQSSSARVLVAVNGSNGLFNNGGDTSTRLMGPTTWNGVTNTGEGTPREVVDYINCQTGVMTTAGYISCQTNGNAGTFRTSTAPTNTGSQLTIGVSSTYLGWVMQAAMVWNTQLDTAQLRRVSEFCHAKYGSQLVRR